MPYEHRVLRDRPPSPVTIETGLRPSLTPMKCPFCGFENDKVVDSRESKEGESIRRRRECLKCEKRFTTYERIDEIPYMVVKKDGRREKFDRQKVLQRAAARLRKAPGIDGQDGTDRQRCRRFRDRLPRSRAQDQRNRRADYESAEAHTTKSLMCASPRFISISKMCSEFMEELKELLEDQGEFAAKPKPSPAD